jgi:hypothetical protein
MEKLEVMTAKGKIEARIGGDPDFPAIDVFVDGELAAMVEFNTCKDGIYVGVYKKSQDEPAAYIEWDNDDYLDEGTN